MKAVRINFSEDLLARFDADEIVRELGRSEVLRRIAELWLHRRESQATADGKSRGHGPDWRPMDDALDVAAPSKPYRLANCSVGNPADPYPLDDMAWPDLRAVIYGDRV